MSTNLDVSFFKSFFLWCTFLNLGILFFWIGLLTWSRNWVHRFHGYWFPMPIEKMLQLHYLMFGLYKLGILLFNFMPWAALMLMGS